MIRDITLHTPHGPLHGQLVRPDEARGLVLIARAHHTPLDAILAAHLGTLGYATLNVELLSLQEAQFVDATQNVPRLTERLLDFLDLARQDGDMQFLPLALLSNGDTTPAAIRAAAQRDTQVRVLACHGGIIDRAGLEALKLLTAPLLTLFDADDDIGPLAYSRAARYLACPHASLSLGTAEDASKLIADWFAKHFSSPPEIRS